MDGADEAQLVETLDREVALRRAVQRHREAQVIKDGQVVCRDCGDPIPDERLKAVPGACRCTQCQQRLEG